MTTNRMGLTPERLEQFIRQPMDNGLTRSEQMEMARELLERRKAETNYHNLPEMERRAEQAECIVMCLNDLGVPQVDGEYPLSLWGACCVVCTGKCI